ncbi:MAG: translocation/assembly module TamB [Tannerella sp.]|jgi:hypothetical protein|nr:translocation/assembly module TamB [Tannerella sp.]
MRVWIRRIAVICLAPIVLLLLAGGFLYIPTVQDAIAKRVVSGVYEAVGMNIEFERVRLAFPLKLSVNDAFVVGKDADTLVRLDELRVQIRLRPLLNGIVSIKDFHFKSLELDTGNSIEGVSVKGHIGKARLRAETVDLSGELLKIDNLALSDAAIDVVLCDTSVNKEDTAQSKWRISLGLVELRDVDLACRMPCDSLFAGVNIDNLVLKDAFADLLSGVYGAMNIHAELPEILYVSSLDDNISGFDTSHIRLSDVFFTCDSIYFGGIDNLHAYLREFHGQEESGVIIKSLTGSIVSDSAGFTVPSIALETGYSTALLQAFAPHSALDSINPSGDASLQLTASVDKRDLMSLVGDRSELYPDTTFEINVSVNGNLKNMNLSKLDVHLYNSLKISASGNMRSILDDKNRMGKVGLTVETGDAAFLSKLLPASLQERFRIPDSMNIMAELNIDKGLYAIEASLKEDSGIVELSGNYDINKNNYEALLRIDSLEPTHFFPTDSLMLLDAFVKLKGHGTDIFATATNLALVGEIRNLTYGASLISGISLTGALEKNHLQARLASDYALAKGTVEVEGDLTRQKIKTGTARSAIRKDVKGRLTVEIDTLDLQNLGLVEWPLGTSFRVVSDVETDLENRYSIDFTLDNWMLTMDDLSAHPKKLTLGLRSDADTTLGDFRAGDLELLLSGSAGIADMADRLVTVSSMAFKQLKRDSMLNIETLRPHFPYLTAHFSANHDNPLYNYLLESNIFYDNIELDAALSPETGLSVNGTLFALVKDTLKIDTVRLSVGQDTLGLLFEAVAVKKRFRNQEPFSATVKGYLHEREADVFLTYINNIGEKGIYLGAKVNKAASGFDLSFYPEKPVIAFLPFTVNEDNFLHFKSLKQMDANLRLDGSDGVSIWIHTGNETLLNGEIEADAMKEIMVELSRIDLGKLSRNFAGMPSLKGLLNATLRYEPMEKTFMVLGDANIDDFYYENGRIGELLFNATYMPMENGTHQVDLHAFYNMAEVASLSAVFDEGRKQTESKIDGLVTINKLPLTALNPIIPGGMAKLEGALLGELSIGGTSGNPRFDGFMQFDKAAMTIVPSATHLRFDEKQIKIAANSLRFDKFNIFDAKNNQLIINGVVDMSNIGNPTTDISMTAKNLQLIDSKKSPETLAYGRMLINLNTTLQGSLQALRMRGDIHILSNTNLTYIMPESPLEAQDHFEGLVTFTYFADTLPRRARRPWSLTGMARNMAVTSGTDVRLTVNIDPTVRLRIDLDEEKMNYVELRGGGDLTLQYTTQGEMKLNGRYSLSDGIIRYSIPVIPLTDFKIKDGSYVDWNGDPMNPYLDLSAYSRIRSSVNFDGQTRMVDFNSGIQLKDNLDDVKVQFLLEAPSDAVVQDQLAAMGSEERSKQAISLLVAGIYLAGGGTGSDNIDVSAALNSLLQREIKNMLGSLLGEVPFSFDVNTYDGTGGMGRRIDYIGRFYKELFNTKLKTELGMRYSTKDPVYKDRFLLDDVSLEYHLASDGGQAVKVFYNKDYKSLFEGEIGKIGAGFTIRRKVKRFRDLFYMPTKSPVTPAIPAVSVKESNAIVEPKNDDDGKE